MNEHTEQNINEAIDWLQQTGGSIQDFAAEQAPLYCQELIKYEIMSSAIGLIGGLVALAMSAIVIRFLRKHEAEMDEGSFYLTFAVGGLLALAGCLFVARNVSPLVKAHTAPRVVIVEHLRSLK